MSATDIAAGPRDRILDAADRLLGQFGYRKMTVEDLAAEAGIGKGTVYLHFRSKEDVALACLDRMARHIERTMAHMAGVGAASSARLREMLLCRVMQRFDYAKSHSRSLEDIQQAIRPGLLAQRTRHFEEEARILGTVIEAGMRAGDFALGNAGDLGLTLVHATNSLLPLSLSAREMGRRADVEARALGIIDLLIAGLQCGRETGPKNSSPRSRSS